jgi:hypothetical protein
MYCICLKLYFCGTCTYLSIIIFLLVHGHVVQCLSVALTCWWCMSIFMHSVYPRRRWIEGVTYILRLHNITAYEATENSLPRKSVIGKRQNPKMDKRKKKAKCQSCLSIFTVYTRVQVEKFFPILGRQKHPFDLYAGVNFLRIFYGRVSVKQ